MVARLASIANGTKRLQVRVLRWSFFSISFNEMLVFFIRTRIEPFAIFSSTGNYSIQ
jgi:hypothetical protein